MTLDTAKLLTSLQEGTLTIKALLRAIAPVYAETGNHLIGEIKASVAHFVTEHPVFLKMQIEDTSNFLRGLDRNLIKNSLQKYLSLSANASQARDPNTFYADASEDEYAAVVQGGRKCMSDTVAAFVNLIHQVTPDTVDTRAREFFNMSVADKHAHNRTQKDTLPLDIITDALYQMAQKATPENLRTAISRLQANPETEQHFDDFFTHLARFIEALIKAAAQSNSLIPADTSTGLKLAANMRFMMTAAEDALVTAGITPDAPLLPQMEAHYITDRTIRLIYTGGDKPLRLPKMNL